jgi:DNA-binding MarR family transcriptional regulator
MKNFHHTLQSDSMPTRQLALQTNAIPDEFFTAVAFLVPYLNGVARNECDISIGGLFVMLHLVISGKQLERPTMLRRDLTDLLRRRGFSQAGISRLMRDLELKGLVSRIFIPTEVREKAFGPSDRTNTQAIVLTPEGEQKIGEFKTALRVHFAHWIASESKNGDWLAKWIGKLLLSKTARRLAQSLIDRIAVQG